jgi:aminoglycoside phosphotransferase (APT) family kinase protein
VAALQVLDWELSTIGHPMADLGNLCNTMFPHPSVAGIFSDPSTIASSVAAESDAALCRPPLDSAEDVISAYCTLTGFDPAVAKLPFFVVYHYFKNCVILHGVAARVAAGNASSAQATSVGAFFPLFAELARDVMPKPAKL